MLTLALAGTRRFEKVLKGNRLARRVTYLPKAQLWLDLYLSQLYVAAVPRLFRLELCWKMNIYYIIENPPSSLIFKHPALAAWSLVADSLQVSTTRLLALVSVVLEVTPFKDM